MESHYLSVGDVAQELQYDERRIRQLLSDGTLKGMKVAGGRKWLIARKDLDRFKGVRRGLTILSCQVSDFRDAQAVARYAWLEVGTASNSEERDCWGRITVRERPGLSLPLHWAGTPITPEESSAPRIAIHPQQPARLDVAFALPSAGRSGKASVQPILSGQMSATPYAPAVQGGQGCWIAQPFALYMPSPETSAYLRSGSYHVQVALGCADGEETRQEFVLTSPGWWQHLDLRGG